MNETTVTARDPLWVLTSLQAATARSLRELPVDLSHRQLAVLLTIYMLEPPHTVSSLALALRISKPAICRALDHLSLHDLIRRKKDEKDRRIVYLLRTVSGSVLVRDMGEIYLQAFAAEKSLN